ncbi:MAG TPA: PDZ domain-containing protein, partial [Polyangiaceae bacterium]|nr:PDZ domain-containing protein [Polyangiaceae bacterium]
MSIFNANWILRVPGHRHVQSTAMALMLWGFLVSACGTTWTGSIGAILAKNNQNGRVFVREVPPEMGAAKAGLFVDDELVAIDGKPVASMASDDLHRALSGKVGTRVRLQILRNGESREVVVERGPLA